MIFIKFATFGPFSLDIEFYIEDAHHHIRHALQMHGHGPADAQVHAPDEVCSENHVTKNFFYGKHS